MWRIMNWRNGLFVCCCSYVLASYARFLWDAEEEEEDEVEEESSEKAFGFFNGGSLSTTPPPLAAAASWILSFCGFWVSVFYEFF